MGGFRAVCDKKVTHDQISGRIVMFLFFTSSRAYVWNKFDKGQHILQVFFTYQYKWETKRQLDVIHRCDISKKQNQVCFRSD